MIRALDPAPYIRNGATLVLEAILDSPFYVDRDTSLFVATGSLETASLRAEVKGSITEDTHQNVSVTVLDAANSIRASWVGGDAPGA
jgi:hypothetical protein